MLACNPTLLSIIVGRSGQELQTASRLIDSQEQRKKSNVCMLTCSLGYAQLYFFILILFMTSCLRNDATHSGLGFSRSIKATKARKIAQPLKSKDHDQNFKTMLTGQPKCSVLH